MKFPIIIRIDFGKGPTERQYVTVAIFALALILLQMARHDPDLWNVELFKILMQAVILTGILNMIAAFHFSANKSDETKSSNTAKAFEAITATANAVTPAADAPSGASDDPVHTVEEGK